MGLPGSRRDLWGFFSATDQPRKVEGGGPFAASSGGGEGLGGGNMKSEQEHKINTHRVITMLDRSEMDFLDKLGKDALFSTGHKLSYNEILKGLIDFIMEQGFSGEKIDSLETLKKKLLKELEEKFKKEFDHSNQKTA